MTTQPTNQPTRAEWWRKVTDPNEVIPKGCPARFEYRGFAQEMDMLEGSVAFERVFDHVLKRDRIYENALLFIDSRWTPPRPAYKVGDVIEDCTPDNLPPEGVGLVNGEGDLCQIRQGRALWAVPAVSYGWEILNDATPLTVVYVPKVGD